MKVAYFSPLPPTRSGIADYSAALLPLLARYAKIDLWTHSSEAACDIPDGCSQILYSNLDTLDHLTAYDVIVYHLGNSPAHRNLYRVFLEYPGVVVLHEFVLHHFLAGYYIDCLCAPRLYLDEMEYSYGTEGRRLGQAAIDGAGERLWERAPLQYPLNERILDHASAVIVHSEFIKGKIAASHPQLRVARINHFARVSDTAPDVVALRKRYQMPKDKVVVAAFGLLTSAKRIDKVLGAVERIARSDVLVLLVGEQHDDTTKIIQRSGIARSILATGYVDGGVFAEYIALSDICVNLRWPTMGETSGSLMTAMAAGKPCIVSNSGWFAELPDNCVAKVNVDEKEEDSLAAHLDSLIVDRALRVAMGENARCYVRENCDIEMIAGQYANFLESIAAINAGAMFKRNFVSSIANAVADIGVDGDDRGIVWELARHLASILRA